MIQGEVSRNTRRRAQNEERAFSLGGAIFVQSGELVAVAIPMKRSRRTMGLHDKLRSLWDHAPHLSLGVSGTSAVYLFRA